LFAAEKQSAYPPPFKQMEEFGLALDSCGLVDLGFWDYPFTWNNKRPGEANTRQRLDRAVPNSEWKNWFPATTVTHLVSHASNHLPLIMQTRSDKEFRNRGTRGFKFEESWLLWDDCEKTVKENWISRSGSDSALVAIQEKINECGVGLQAWGSQKTHPDTEEIKRL